MKVQEVNKQLKLYSYNSNDLDREVTFRVLVPHNYDANKKYKVIYMHDGKNLFYDHEATFNKSWKMIDALKELDLDIIIVGIDNNTKPYGRANEYSWYHCEHTIKNYKLTPENGGLGKQYLNTVIKDIIPAVESSYSVESDREGRIMIGSSLGGLITLNAMTYHNDVFSKYGCISNAFWYCQNKLEEELLKFETTLKTRVYLDCGTQEDSQGDNSQLYVDTNKKVFDILSTKNIELDLQIIDGAIHDETAWSKRIVNIVKWLMEEK